MVRDQSCQWRKGKARQCHQTRGHTGCGGPDPPGNLLRQQIAQEVEQPVLCGPAEQGADKAGQQAKHAQLQGIEQQRVMAGKAQQRSSALASKRRVAKRAADSATATPANRIAAGLARFR